MKQKQMNKSMLSFGIQFTASMILPVFVCVYLGVYFKNKYNLGSWFILVMIALSFAIIVADVVSFAKVTGKKADNKLDSGSIKGEDKRRNKERY